SAGIRQRCDLPRAERVRRSRRAAPYHRHRERPRHRCLSQRLVFNVLGVSGMGEADVPPEPPPDAEQPLIDLQETYRSLTAKNLLESYHDTQQALDQALNLFSLGYLSLEQRCVAENLYWEIGRA